MEYTVNGHNVFSIVISTFLISTFLIPLVKKIASHVKAIDCPGERKVHLKPIPRLGGLAIFLSFLFGYMFFANQSTEMLAILIGGFIIMLVGFIDDIKPINYRYKLLGQVIAASVVVFYGGILLSDVNAFGFHFAFGIFSYPITIFFIIALTNAINLIDGIDGLSSGISSIYFLTIAIIAFIMNKLAGLDVIFCLIMLGSTLGLSICNLCLIDVAV